ncbi:MAG: adenine deaminase [Anaerolineae bacterium]|nr:adenine deaminase [Anaerolineae bacterium]
MKRETLLHLLAVARGDEPADLVLRNGHVVNVFSGEILDVDIAIAGEYIAAVGLDYDGKTEIDLQGQYVVPGLIDTHVHVESSMCSPPQFARAIVPHGVTTVVSDPHEIANVAGSDGIRYMLAASEGLPLTVFVNLPSCVPATHMGTAGANLEAEDLLAMAGLPRVLGLAEFMNVPGAVLGLPGAIEKILAFRDGHIDGHAPEITGKWLQAYIAAGPATDHESMSAGEALEKVRLGMYVLIREATAAKNLKAILPMLTPENARRLAFSTDDRHPADLIDKGSIDNNLRETIAAGVDPITAIRIATLNGAEAFGLKDRGAIGPGRRADIVITPTLDDFYAAQVFSGGQLVAENGKPVGTWVLPQVDESAVRSSINVDMEKLSFYVPAAGKKLRVIGIVPEQVVTSELVLDAKIVDGEAVPDTDRDILKLAIVERHKATGKVGIGFVQGLGLKQGAIAGSVGHDCHNITVAGVDDASMYAAVKAVKELGGGLVAVIGEQVISSVPLPIGGLMSDQSVETVRQQMDALLTKAEELGSPLHDPFMHLGFLALEVIGKLKLTDQGLVDVDKFDFVPLWVE